MSHFRGVFKLHETTFPRGDAGRLAQLMGFMLKGQTLKFKTASTVMQQLTGSKQGALAKASFTKFIGRSSDNLCIAYATLPCKIYEIQMDEKLKKLPKELREYYVQSAISDALSKARRMVYEESEEGRLKAISLLAEAISTREGLPAYMPTDGWDYYQSGALVSDYIREGLFEGRFQIDSKEDLPFASEFFLEFKSQYQNLPKIASREIGEIKKKFEKEKKLLELAELAKKKEEEEAEKAQKELKKYEELELEKNKPEEYEELGSLKIEDIEIIEENE